jgi:uncharacterized membrane protein YdcZ (DUF606 family)
MNTIVWFVVLLLLGFVTGKMTGAGLAFTRGRASYDLAGGVLGAIIVAVPLRWSGLTGYSAALPTLIMGVSAAMLAAWLIRVVTWAPEPRLCPVDDVPRPSNRLQTHDVMTTSDGTRLLMSTGKLVVR